MLAVKASWTSCGGLKFGPMILIRPIRPFESHVAEGTTVETRAIRRRQSVDQHILEAHSVNRGRGVYRWLRVKVIVCLGIHGAMRSSGVAHPRTWRGRVLRRCSTRSRSCRVWRERSVDFGKYWRSRPLTLLCQVAGWSWVTWCCQVARSWAMARYMTSIRWRLRMRRAPRTPLVGVWRASSSRTPEWNLCWTMAVV